MADFIKLYEVWTADGALEMKVLEASEERFDFDITRCRYAETYQEMGLGKIGHLLSCNRDGTFCQGYDPRISLERKQTIMQGGALLHLPLHIRCEGVTLPAADSVSTSSRGCRTTRRGRLNPLEHRCCRSREDLNATLTDLVERRERTPRK